jgi:hypothetical protein
MGGLEREDGGRHIGFDKYPTNTIVSIFDASDDGAGGG